MGHHNIRFDGDPYAGHGVWSPPTSRANFCEEDYVITFYIAEFINALTNIAYVYYALKAIYPRGRGRPKPDFMSLSLLVLGLGSFLFHATLRQALEFVDEFSMLGLTWSMLQASLTARQPPARERAITAALAVVYPCFAAFYLWSAKIVYHSIAFVAALLVVLARSQYTLHVLLPTCAKRWDWNARIWKALGWCVLGYVLWTVDLEYCAELRALRGRVGLPWAWLLEFHGWWHILTAAGASQAMQVAREVREQLELEKEAKRE
ncbi:alkaline phytoceramidase [Parathielavia hyrcaniae]|uniref:Alkaline phytoceramidase n=1 Tax=Parathielavia hyrcaniae TaxID=113614 RepID=A0AAN6Q586_9PEZI|nr:alkaline phytoceramidase [Parathielavia hyrcaniae]